MQAPYPPRLLVGIAAGEWWDAKEGLTAVDVADRMSEYGDAPSSATMSRLKNGREGVSIDRWLTLALALRVPPLALLFPPDAPERGREGIEVAPGVVMSPRWAWAWAIGDEDPPPLDGVSGGERWKSDWRERERSARLVRERREALNAWHKAHQELASVESTDAVLRDDDAARAAGEPSFTEFDAEQGTGVDTDAWRAANYTHGVDAAARLAEATAQLERLEVEPPTMAEPVAEAFRWYAETSPGELARARWEIRLGDARTSLLEATAAAARARNHLEQVRQEQP